MIVLSIMILPTITAISRDALVSVPSKLRMAVYGLGATRWETILSVILPTASRGVVGGVLAPQVFGEPAHSLTQQYIRGEFS